MSEIPYSRIIGDALRRDALSVRALPMIALMVAEGFIFILLFLHLASRLLHMLSNTGASLASLFSSELLSSAILWLLALIILLFLFEIVGLWLAAAIMRQSYNDVSGERVPGFAEAFISVKGRMFSLIMAFILVTLISAVLGALAGNVPYLGGFLSAVVSLLMSMLLFMVYPYVVLAHKGAIDSISASFNHFTSRMSQLFLMWLLSVVIGIIIVFVFAIPMIAAIISFGIKFLQTTQSASGALPIISSIINALSSPMFLASVIVLMIGVGVSVVFSYGVLARYYYEVTEIAGSSDTPS